MAEVGTHPQRRGGGLRADVADYRTLAAAWGRAAMSYRASFVMLSLGGLVITALDFVAIAVLLSRATTLGGFGLREIALLYGASGLGIAVADLAVGQVERLGRHIRSGRLDTMLVRPTSLLVQVCTEEFSPRRISRVVQAAVVFGWGCGAVAWTPERVLLAGQMLVSATLLFGALFVGLACLQFWTTDGQQVANAFTYGGNTVTQYPLVIFPREVVLALTFAVPLAFVSWYPSLRLLDRPDPLGLPAALAWCSPVAVVLAVLATVLVWRAGVRRYTSTGS